ncbi:MAG TPA: SAM-dependent methyltransferase [Clostridiales bacterium]|nr:MAG: hypothetical protein A2Y18_01715 [Clostridiales bacterium GWD2_32_19]HCC07076.1 SAM-dependent methyltransferase [Clostridiales bacterium]
MNNIISPDERIDDLEIKNYHIIQNKKMFCFGVDAVLLSDFARVKKDDTVLDMCTGNGVIAMLLEAKTEAKYITGIDILEKNIDMANRSIKMNEQTDKVCFIQGDVNDSREIFKEKEFDIITCNPPYMENNKGLKNEITEKIIARHEVLCTLEDIISNASSVLTHNGRIYMIHRPHRLTDIIHIMKKYKIELKRLRNVYPTIDKPPTMILVEGVKHAKPYLVIDQPLIIYNKEGSYTEEIMRMYGK